MKNKSFYERHPEVVKARTAAWRKANPEKYAAMCKKNQADYLARRAAKIKRLAESL